MTAARPRHITAVGRLCIVTGGVLLALTIPTILTAGALIAPGEPSTDGRLAADLMALALFVILPVAVSIGFVIVGLKLLEGRRWARNVALVLCVAVLALSGSPFPSFAVLPLLLAVAWVYALVALLAHWAWFEVKVAG